MKIIKYLLLIGILFITGCDDVLGEIEILNDNTSSINNLRLIIKSKINCEIHDFSVMKIDKETNTFVADGICGYITNKRQKNNFIIFYTNSINNDYINYTIVEQLQYNRLYEFSIRFNPPLYCPTTYFKLLPELTNIILTNGEVVEKTNTQLKWSYKLEDLTN